MPGAMHRSPLPGPFRFMALDVETADRDRGSICQVGVAAVRADGTLATWASYVDPGPSDWSCSFVHGITAATVRGAPRFDAVLPVIAALIGTRLVFQHSGFDRSAIAAACARHGAKDVDGEIMSLLDASAVTFQVVLTKADKVKEAEREKVLARTREALAKHPAAFPELIVTSSEKGWGIPTLRAMIAGIA
jgi:DNA polymerase III epsilon subunit-like protein